MNIGIIGTGRIAHKFAEAIKNVDGVKLYAISSRTLSSARKFAEEFNCILWYEGTEDFYINKEIDLVYIATPNSSHYQYTIDCIKANKPVLCEKPFALNYKQAEEMISMAHEKKILLVEAMWTKFFPAIQKVKEVLDSGILGDIVTVHGDLSYPLDKNKERLYKKELGGGALLDLGVYPISIAHYFLGKPDSIKALAHFTESGVDETTSVLFNYKSGITGILNCSMVASSTNEFLISCKKGWIRINDSFHHPTSISCFIPGKGEQHLEFPRDTYGYEYQIEGVKDHLMENLTESPIVTFKQTLEVMEILDRVREEIGYSFD